tara:strand:+ start:2145 stop:3098 length:954 start_codon:yes stop_codon:yes gene_type:complete
LNNLTTVLLAVAKIALVVSISGFLVRKRVVSREVIKPISALVVTFFLPALIFSNILGKLDIQTSPNWWYLPFTAIVMTAIALLIALIGPSKVLKERREIIPASFLQNAAFLILPLGQALLSRDDFDIFTLSVFLFIAAYNPCLWLFGKHFMRKRSNNEPFLWKNILSTPLIASLASLTLVLTGIRDIIPNLFIETAGFIGAGTVPVATFVLGATLGGLNIDFQKYWKDTLFVASKKLFVIPALMITAMHFIPWLHSSPLLLLFFILQAASPPATTLAIQSQTYNDNSERIASILFGTYLLCIITIPAWILVAQSLFG